MGVKINSLEIENVKRIKAVMIEPTASGLTVIGGGNGEGKTSVLDAIAWALGGENYRPSAAQREGSMVPPRLHVVLSNGIVVDRAGKNSALKVSDPEGKRAGQQLLNEFISQFALDLPRFMKAAPKEKANILLKTIGVGDELFVIEQKESQAYQERLAVGRIADQKKKHAAEMPVYDGVPDQPVSAAELIRQQQDILARNGEKARIRANADEAERRAEMAKAELVQAESLMEETKARLDRAIAAYNKACEDKETAFYDADNAGEDESTAELEASIQEIDEINRKVRANLDKEKAEDEAAEYSWQYDALTESIGKLRADKIALLEGAGLPLPGLSVEDGELTYNGQKWDNMSGSEQLMVSAAIVRKLNPECGFILMDKLEQMDLTTLQKFGKWLEAEGLQAIATRVSTGGECDIIIEDGYVKGTKQPEPAPPKWKKGEF